MTMVKQPRLLRGGLSGRVYVVTAYKDLGDGRLEAITKYDVTEDFDRLARAVIEEQNGKDSDV